MVTLPRIMLAAEKSGAGKTTLTCALLQALLDRGLTPAACKCGPDFIDPLFHSEVIGVHSCNLDLFFTPPGIVRQLLGETADGCDIAVLEGVMGYYDGVGGTTDTASSYHLATETGTPVVLVLDARGAALSLCATLRGFLHFRENSGIAGVILNRCTQGQYAMLAPMLEQQCGVEMLGYMPVMADCVLNSRHLGLVTAAEVDNLRQKLITLACRLEQSVNVQRLLQLADTAPHLCMDGQPVQPVSTVRPRIAVARDRAFCFYYRENLELLQKLGAEQVTFSPLEDESLPSGTDAIYLGGGYPELYGEQLSQNVGMLRSINAAIAAGTPTLAECGGFIYLTRSLTDSTGTSYPLVGAIDTCCHDTGKLSRFGYVSLRAQEKTMLCDCGETIPAHEFHYYDSEDNGKACHAVKPISGRNWQCIHSTPTLFAGFPHLYFYGNRSFAEGFVTAAANHKLNKD